MIPPIALLGYLYSPLFGRRDGLKILWLALMVCGIPEVEDGRYSDGSEA